MPFDFGTIIGQKDQVAGSVAPSDIMAMANSGSFGDTVSTGLTVALQAASKTVLQAAASVLNVGRLLKIVGSTADDGVYMIGAAVASTSYDLITSTGADFSATNSESGSWGAIYYRGNLEDDLNYNRTKAKEINGTANWNDAQPTYATPSAIGTPVSVTIDHLKDAHTKYALKATSVLSGAFTMASSDTEKVVTDTTLYRDTTARRTGLPTADGANTPDATNYNLTFVRVLNSVTMESAAKADSTPIWGRMIAGSAGTNFKVKLYTGDNSGSASAFTCTTAESGQSWVFQYHKAETIYSLTDNNMVGLESGYILHAADAELMDDVRDLQTFAGSGDNVSHPVLTNYNLRYPFQGLSSPTLSDVTAALNILNLQVGDQTYTGGIITTGQTAAQSLQALSDAMTTSSTGWKVYRKRITGSAINKGSPVSLPGTFSYKPNAATEASGIFGKYLKVSVQGVNYTPNASDHVNDYAETSGGTEGATAGTITFSKLDLKVNDHIIFEVAQPNS
jgi:hypothetical protein